MKFLLTIAVLGSIGISVFANEPPRNPFLADSPWPMTHRNSYCQHSSPLRGPVADDEPEVIQLPVPRGSITLSVGETKDGITPHWGSVPAYGLQKSAQVYTFHGDAKNYWMTGKTSKSTEGTPHKTGISGAYVILDRDGNFITPEAKALGSYAQRDHKVPPVKTGSCGLPLDQLKAEDLIVGINMTYDGHVVVATTTGLVGVVPRASVVEGTGKVCEGQFLRLQSPDPAVPVSNSNSLSVDDDGGIYVVTNRLLHRVQWEPAKKELSVRWAVAYSLEESEVLGRLSEGSGTTPALMGSGNDEKFVVITDARRRMNIVLYWRDQIPADWKPGLPENERRLAGEIPIEFGAGNGELSSTEQSPIVWGDGIVVVNNAYGNYRQLYKRKPALRWQGGDTTFNLLNLVLTKTLGAKMMTIFYSNFREVAPLGMQKVRWNSQKRKLENAWANASVSCPNAVPTMSAASNLVYCVGASKEKWTIEGVNWDTGVRELSLPLPDDQQSNSFYSATQICGDRTICTGNLYGAYVIRPIVSQ